MASGGKRGGVGERVLESRHVIGLFMLMLLFSGVFFTLGYVMGRNQYDSPVRASTDFFKKPENFVFPDRKSTRLNSSHLVISYAVFCLKKKSSGEPTSDSLSPRSKRS